ncbi:TIGR03617 family F420-dependent LLM class oxidoreductase [Kutzneria buriramensis]|uniref:Putative F420-dependent oxidoreductase n=1 Tax=Kutzneria buriramensis TaxID=1045776 RepID=A0A3E0HLX3_9PSEU|nr:TIGR03617 family F420-dependent LLM class oxidoreductase [Kutzneria buriramensis]REH47035.1 putative F420-dependent oxidoreductase [Kutzneria buriramensis]
MRVDFHTISVSPTRIAEIAAEVEDIGYDSLWTSEIQYDPFIGLALAAQRSSTLALRTGLAVAFARNPMTMAILANDLQTLSGGRFSLGIGSQIKAHITRRFSMPWSQPAARMREYVLAMRAIWESWATGGRLRFRGEFYRHTLMVPFFNPGPNEFGPPPVLLAGVGERMTAVAGETADGFLAHIITTRKFLQDFTLPILSKARAEVGRSMDDFEIHITPIVATGRTEEEYRSAVDHAKQQLAFYAAIPSYTHVLETHGLEDLRDDLHRLSAEGRLAEEAAAVIDDGVLDTFTLVGEHKEVAAKLHQRFGDLVTSMSFYQLHGSEPENWRPILAELRRLQQ